MMRHAVDDGLCRATHKTLAKEFGLSVRTIRRRIDKLEEAWLIRSVQRGSGLPSVYEFRGTRGWMSCDRAKGTNAAAAKNADKDAAKRCRSDQRLRIRASKHAHVDS